MTTLSITTSSIPNGPVMSHMDDQPKTPSSVEQGNSSVQGRATWSRKAEFILTLIGYAVGLGNLWRFPYLTYQNGGGAFLIPYILMLFLVGVPIFYMEISLGQFGSLGPVAIFKLTPFLKGVGVAAIIVNIIIVIYYNVIVTWAMYFFFASMGPDVPWRHCNNPWNTPNCVEGRFNASIHGNLSTTNLKTPSEEYFYNKVLQLSSGIDRPDGLVWQLSLLLLVSWTILFFAIIKGIHSLGKVAYFVSLSPYVLLTIMIARGASLEGASRGIEYYVRPNFQRLSDVKVWTSAASQICFSLGICCGNLIAMASFNNFHSNVRRDALTIPFVNCGTSFYGGFAIFSVLGFMAQNKGVNIDQVVASGPALVFVVYPEGLAQMPLSPVWSVLFFLMMCILGLSSQCASTEAIACVFLDEFPVFLRSRLRPVLLRASLCLAMFLLGLPMVSRGGYYLFRIVDEFSADYSLLAVGILELVTIHYFYGHKNFSRDISLMLGSEPGLYWQVTWRFLSPVILIVLIIIKATQQSGVLRWGSYLYPTWATAIAWMIVAFPLVMVVIMALTDCLSKGGVQALKNSIKSSDDWGPAKQENRQANVYQIRDRRISAQAISLNDSTTNLSNSVFELNKERIEMQRL